MHCWNETNVNWMDDHTHLAAQMDRVSSIKQNNDGAVDYSAAFKLKTDQCVGGSCPLTIFLRKCNRVMQWANAVDPPIKMHILQIMTPYPYLPYSSDNYTAQVGPFPPKRPLRWVATAKGQTLQ